VEAGGDLVTGAPPPGEDGWTVNVPHRLSGDSTSVITVAHSAVATSGDGVQYVEIEGTRYSHVINPRTGLGLIDQPTTTVVAPNGLVADAVATTVGILGAETGRSFVKTYHPGATVYVTADGSTCILQRP
jgi:thiamine biosynthesis lipoprotein